MLSRLVKHDTDLHADLVDENDDRFDLATMAVILRSACDMSALLVYGKLHVSSISSFG